jgi:hypothetical protein
LHVVLRLRRAFVEVREGPLRLADRLIGRIKRLRLGVVVCFPVLAGVVEVDGKMGGRHTDLGVGLLLLHFNHSLGDGEALVHGAGDGASASTGDEGAAN